MNTDDFHTRYAEELGNIGPGVSRKTNAITNNTMTTTEKLQRIKQRCEELLALAEKRTTETHCPDCGSPWECHEFGVPKPYCATPLNKYAEAGWRSTIAAIDGLLAAESLIYSVQNDYDESPVKWWIEQRGKVMEAQDAIIAAWPDETL